MRALVYLDGRVDDVLFPFGELLPVFLVVLHVGTCHLLVFLGTGGGLDFGDDVGCVGGKVMAMVILRSMRHSRFSQCGFDWGLENFWYVAWV